jgi:hypothetical protein
MKLKLIVKPQPDENDADFYCHPCKKYSSSGIGYRYHLRSVHKVNLWDQHRPKMVNPDILPDVNNSNFY